MTLFQILTMTTVQTIIKYHTRLQFPSGLYRWQKFSLIGLWVTILVLASVKGLIVCLILPKKKTNRVSYCECMQLQMQSMIPPNGFARYNFFCKVQLFFNDQTWDILIGFPKIWKETEGSEWTSDMAFSLGETQIFRIM